MVWAAQGILCLSEIHLGKQKYHSAFSWQAQTKTRENWRDVFGGGCYLAPAVWGSCLYCRARRLVHKQKLGQLLCAWQSRICADKRSIWGCPGLTLWGPSFEEENTDRGRGRGPHPAITHHFLPNYPSLGSFFLPWSLLDIFWRPCLSGHVLRSPYTLIVLFHFRGLQKTLYHPS